MILNDLWLIEDTRFGEPAGSANEFMVFGSRDRAQNYVATYVPEISQHWRPTPLVDLAGRLKRE